MNDSAVISINSDSITVRQSSGSAESTLYENGFHLIFVTNGTVEFSSAAGTATAASDSLILLTPSMSARITRKDNGARTTVVHIVPNYFDSLPDGQLMYQQFSQYMGRNSLPVFRLSPENARNMYRTIALFNEQLNRFRFYRIGTLRHICSLLLLQIAETLHSYEEETTVCLRHSDDIFRKFKQMAHEHYSSHHDIAFYANWLNISTTYLSRIVKQTSGRTVHAHISELLMAEAKRLQKKIEKNQFDFNDFLTQIHQIKKMGNLKDLASMIPGVGKAIKDIDIDDNAFKSIEAIIYSMTPQERSHPEILNSSRRMRIAKGSGTSIQDVNRLLKQFDQTRKMMKMVTGGKMAGMMQRMKKK